MKRMNRRRIVTALLALTAAGWGATAFCALQPVTILPEAVTLFGEAEGTPVKSGFVFVDGRLIRPPYKVGRKGNGIFINGSLFQKLAIAAAPPAPPEERKPAPAKTAAPTAPSKDKEAADALGIGDLIDVDDEAGVDAGYVGQDAAPSIAPRAEPRPAPAAAVSPLGRPATPQLSGQKKKKKYDANDLFEEADYTFTPPKRPEPPAVPYVRPAAEKTMKERMEETKQREAARAASGDFPLVAADDDDSGTIPDDGAPEEVESFEGIDEVRVANAQKAMDGLCRRYEALLRRGDLVYGGAGGGSIGTLTAKQALLLMQALPELLKAASSTDFEMGLQGKGFLALDPAFVQQVFENRMMNAAPVTFMIKQMERDEAARKAAQADRLR